jgi:hypothetical protein
MRLPAMPLALENVYLTGVKRNNQAGRMKFLNTIILIIHLCIYSALFVSLFLPTSHFPNRLSFVPALCSFILGETNISNDLLKLSSSLLWAYVIYSWD